MYEKFCTFCTNIYIKVYEAHTLQTHHVDSTLKRLGNGRFHVVSTWNPRGVFVGYEIRIFRTTGT